ALPAPADGGPAGACAVTGKVGGGAPPPVGETRVEGVLCMVGAIGPVCATRVAFVVLDGRGSTSKTNSGPAGPSCTTSPGLMREVPVILWRFTNVPLRLFRSVMMNCEGSFGSCVILACWRPTRSSRSGAYLLVDEGSRTGTGSLAVLISDRST